MLCRGGALLGQQRVLLPRAGRTALRQAPVRRHALASAKCVPEDSTQSITTDAEVAEGAEADQQMQDEEAQAPGNPPPAEEVPDAPEVDDSPSPATAAEATDASEATGAAQASSDTTAAEEAPPSPAADAEATREASIMRRRRSYSQHSENPTKGEASRGDWASDELVEDHDLKPGQTVTGTVVWSNDNGARVQLTDDERIIGYMPHTMGAISVECGSEGPQPASPCLPTGMRRQFKVLNVPDRVYAGGKGPLLCASDLDRELQWVRIVQLYDICHEAQEVLTVKVVNRNSGGLTTYLQGVRCFIPISHIPRPPDTEWLGEEELDAMVGSEVEVIPVEVQRGQRRVVLSIRGAAQNRSKRGVAPGALVWGTVNRLMNFGLFLTLDDFNVSALLHISNISQDHTAEVGDLFAIGDRVRVVIVGMEEDFSRISVSTAELEAQAGDMHRDREAVYAGADENVEAFREYLATAAAGEEEDGM